MTKLLTSLLIVFLFPITSFAGTPYSWHWNSANVTPWYRGTSVAYETTPIKIYGFVGATTSITLRLWAGGGGVTGNLALKVFDSSGQYLVSSNNIDASTLTSYSGSTWFPPSTSTGSYITFTFSNPIPFTTSGFFLSLDTSGLNRYYDVFYATAYGSGYDSGHNKVCYQQSTGQLPACSDDSESADISVGFATIQAAYPLGENRTISGYGFGVNWEFAKCPDPGPWKLHVGVDYSASAGDDVFAIEAGEIKAVIDNTSVGWAKALVIEHTHPDGWTYTTVYWHINPLVESGSVNKGDHIADVADLPNPHLDHFHLGLRLSGYVAGVSGVGALPTTSCGGYPAFSNGFIDVADTQFVSYQ